MKYLKFCSIELNYYLLLYSFRMGIVGYRGGWSENKDSCNKSRVRIRKAFYVRYSKNLCKSTWL